MSLFRASALLLLAASVIGCAGAAPGTKPHDMSTAEHRKHAEQEAQTAEQHQARYDPDATAITARGGNAVLYYESVYNPTRPHLGHAKQHQGLAKAHLAAAQALEKFTESECKSFPAATRKVCPLLGHVKASENIEGGVRVTFADGVNVPAAVAHVKCHVAFAATQGYQGMNQCPMYIKGVTVKRAGDGPTLDFLVEDEAARKDLRSRAAAHVAR